MASGAEAECLYAVLGVPAGADASSLRQAFLAAARSTHPDRAAAGSSSSTASPSPPGQPSAAFARVQGAWEVLGDARRRAAYDAARAEAAAAAAAVMRRPRPQADDAPRDEWLAAHGDSSRLCRACRCGGEYFVDAAAVAAAETTAAAAAAAASGAELGASSVTGATFTVQCDACSLYVTLRM